MLSLSRSVRRFGVASLILAAGLAAPALAQDGKLTVQASPQIVLPGQSADIQVRAHIPPTAYAFAAAQFDVFATAPSWTFASAGAIVGNDVLAIGVSQPHMPHIGIMADPSNPLDVWTGTFTPASDAPALIEIKAEPSLFSVYPSPLTSSFAYVDAEGGSDMILVNPVAVGAWRAAPGNGARIHTSDDVWVDGRIITAPNDPSPAILMALLLPAVQNAREAAVRVGFDGMPESFAVETQVVQDDFPSESLSLNFTKAAFDRAYEIDTNFPLGVGLQIQFSCDGTNVAKLVVPEGRLPFTVERVPDTVQIGVGPHVRVFSGQTQATAGASRHSGLVLAALYDGSVRIMRPNGKSFLADRIEVRGAVKHANNLRQIGLGMHTFEARGVESMRLAPRQP